MNLIKSNSVTNDTGWGTWNPDRPVELCHLQHGFSLTPVIYSARGNKLSTIASNKGFTFGTRSIDGRHIEFSTEHYDTKLDWRYQLSGAEPLVDEVETEWHSRAHGEWGLRFWVCICVSGPPGCQFEYDRENNVLVGRLAESGSKIVVQSAKAPLMATFHENLDELCEEMHEHGYFYLASRGTHGHFAVLRYNLEEAPSMRLSAIVTSDSTGSFDPVRPTLPDPISDTADSCLPATPASIPSPTPAQRSLLAIHDVVSWNHVFDKINQRPYTVLTRNWNTHKFGGFGVWMNDVIYNALMWSLFDHKKARQNIEAVFAWQTPEGNFPCLVTGNDAWVDRSQPPIVSYVVWVLFQRSSDLDFLSWAFDCLLKNHHWWWNNRELNSFGLVAYGTSLDSGDGLYKGTKLAAKDESSMDNMPLHDPAPFNEETGMLESFDVGLNSLLALDAEVLAQMARVLNQSDEADRLAIRSEQHKQLIAEHLWDSERGVFANRLLSGEFVQSLAPTSFYPLAAGIGSDTQCQSLIGNYFNAPEKFGGTYGLPSCTRDDPAYHDNVYWRGRIWAPLNYWVYLGMVRSGETTAALALADSSLTLFENSWQHRLCGENYNAETGEVLDQADTDAFYSWGALLPLIKLSTVVNETPWSGLCISTDQIDGSIGPIQSSIGVLEITECEDCWEIVRNGSIWLRGTAKGNLVQIKSTEDSLSMLITNTSDTAWLECPEADWHNAMLGGKPLTITAGRISLPLCEEKSVFECH